MILCEYIVYEVILCEYIVHDVIVCVYIVCVHVAYVATLCVCSVYDVIFPTLLCVSVAVLTILTQGFFSSLPINPGWIQMRAH